MQKQNFNTSAYFFISDKMITTNTTEQLLIPVNLQNIKHFDCTCTLKKNETSLKETCSKKITLQYHRINQNIHREKFRIQKKIYGDKKHISHHELSKFCDTGFDYS